EEIRAALERGEASDAERFLAAIWRLGGFVLFYEPEPAAAELDRLFERYPDLSALRLRAGDHMRLTRYPRRGADPTRPPTSSLWSLEVAQLWFERGLDLLAPDGALALQAQDRLAAIALDQGDFDDARMRFDLVRGHPRAGDPDRIRALWLKGVAAYRQARYGESAAALRESVRIRPELRALWNLRLALEAEAEPGLPAFPLRPEAERPSNPTGLAFTDVAPALGVNRRNGAGPSAWGDYDGDGDSDLFVTGCDVYSILYRNDGERFTDVSREAGLELVESSWSSTFVDTDNDGDPDLYLGRNGWNGPGRNSLFENRGDGTFAEVTDQAGVNDPGSTFVHAWTDYDRDGRLDLVLANGVRYDGSVNRLYRNRGDGTFADVTEEAGLLEPPGIRTIGLAVGDYDRDGWPDLFFQGYFNEPNRLYRNRGDGSFEEVAGPAGVRGGPRTALGYVCFLFDYDNDARPDLLLTKLASWTDTLMGMSAWLPDQPEPERQRIARMAPELYRNNGDGTFTDVSAAAGFRYPHGIMAAGIADLDNDGFQDLYLGTGEPPLFRLEPNILYRNVGGKTFADVTRATTVGHLGKGHGITFLDLDRDGRLDIFSPVGGFVHGDLWENALYRNDTRNDYHWVQFRLEGTRSNRDAVGAQLTATSGPMTQYREVSAGGAFGVSNEPVVHFGLGTARRVDRLQILWPSGLDQTFTGVAADRRWFLREGEALREDAAGGGGQGTGSGPPTRSLPARFAP
ncbi:MAG: VCBS repeat-containing protein, partial [Acidobacteria bacterium]|nr:VCBS repeat-containing protein [Acidobacteriota bacterium]